MEPGAGLAFKRAIMMDLIDEQQRLDDKMNPVALRVGIDTIERMSHSERLVPKIELDSETQSQILSELQKIDAQKTSCCKKVFCCIPAAVLGFFGGCFGCIFDLFGGCCEDRFSFTKQCAAGGFSLIFPSKAEQKRDVIKRYRQRYLISNEVAQSLICGNDNSKRLILVAVSTQSQNSASS
jgi:hypothetical protein